MPRGKTTIVTSRTVDGEEYVSVDSLPDMNELRLRVKQTVDSSGWFERFGQAWLEVLLAAVLYVVGVRLLAFNTSASWLAAFLTISICHSVVANRAGHLASHGALCVSRAANRFWTWLFVEVVGAFSVDVARQTHIREHHPYTNVIGLGDSSSWKMPALPRYVYMFVAPLLLPSVTPIVAVAQLMAGNGATSPSGRRPWPLAALACFLASAGAGLAAFAVLYHSVGGVYLPAAVPVVFASRAAFGVPYIHVNIFQHIGLPMYSLKNMPRTIYQMSTGVLNLHGNTLLNWAMGHSLISCHVEHHLFPSLSDSMCLKIKPIVRSYLTEHGLPYHETSYGERLLHFLHRYEKLMVQAPPITHFVGLP